jgi:hypothetical protein
VADEPEEATSLNERLLDALVFAPAGLVISAFEEFPKLAELGRHKLGVQLSSARAVGQFAVRAGRRELVKRSEVVRHHRKPVPGSPPGPTGLRSIGTEGNGSTRPAPPSPPTVAVHVPSVAELAIPAFDTLSASQVVQRLDGLSRSQLVTARAYEAGTRGRRTILSRIDQLLDERA